MNVTSLYLVPFDQFFCRLTSFCFRSLTSFAESYITKQGKSIMNVLYFLFSTNYISHRATICFQSPTSSPTSSPTPSPTLSLCTITEGYSDGSAGDLTIITDSTGNQVLALVKEDGTIDSSRFSGTTLGTAPDVTTVIEDINYFIIPAGQTVYVLGTLIVKAKGMQIDGELNGNGGGYDGGVSPLGTNGHGKNGSYSGGVTGGGGGSHGKLLFWCVSLLLFLLMCLTITHSLLIHLLGM